MLGSRHGSVCSVRAGVHPGLVRAHGGRAVQRRRRESDPQKQPEFPRAAAAFLPADLGRYALTPRPCANEDTYTMNWIFCLFSTRKPAA